MGFQILIIKNKLCTGCSIKNDLISEKNISTKEASSCPGNCGALGMICAISILEINKKPFYSQKIRKKVCQVEGTPKIRHFF